MHKLILVVEDETPIREILIELFNDEDHYKGIGAGDGLEALELLKTITFDLITLDMNMPKMNGNTFLLELSNVASSIPVIVITANPKTLKSHPQVKDVIAKPFDVDQILSSVRTIIT